MAGDTPHSQAKTTDGVVIGILIELKHYHVLDRLLLEVPYRLHQWARATNACDMSILFGLQQRISAMTRVCLPGGTAWFQNAQNYGRHCIPPRGADLRGNDPQRQ